MSTDPPSIEPTLPADTPAAVLEALARQDSPALRAAVARHPNTPPALLEALAATEPGAVLSNPALPLLRLAHPRLLLDTPRATLLALVGSPAAPDWLRRHALTHPDAGVVAAVASHPHLTPAQLAALAGHPAWQVRSRVAARPDLRDDTLRALAADPDYGVRMYVAARPDLPHGVQAQLQQDASVFVRQVLARHAR
ncbi:hypothetical protein IHN63_06445 [Deinococcus sp. 6YEL10]|uniref:variant leucine-rich repeat-containing protein n=1 Tax=Deinococcus sp. 6YEL10 TaxID=2745870 RepID=UPI001E5D83AE|nr:hypothetical protein [Deinococcus sp. 6YEL10]MCD0160949.1 hypothetical protein [Deinococcus sp. 6YEL10]